MQIKGLFDYTQPLVAGATVLGVGIILASLIAATAAYRIKVADDTISVTGSAKESVVADFARWTINLETKTSTGDQQAGLDRLEKAKDTISAYLAKQGLTDIETPVASVSAEYTYPQASAPVMIGYSVSRHITVRSSDIDKISELANNMAPLSGYNYNVSSFGLELTYQKLDEMRVKLLSEAIKDAEARAEAIAKETKRSVGILRSATGGVVQVLPQGGVEISDYGSYDTQSKNKDVMVTVRAQFSLR